MDPLGRVTRNTHDALDRVVATTAAADLPEAGTTGFAYDAAGNLIERTDANGRVTSFAYDALNRVGAETDALGESTAFTYDATGNLATATDRRGFTTSFAYDALNRQVETTNPLGHTYASVFDGVGNLTASVDPLGRTTRFAYDALDRRTGTTTPTGDTFTTSFDLVGNAVATVDAEGNPTAFTYDLRDRLVSSVDAEGDATAYAYDDAGRLLTETDALGRVATSVYDGLDRVVEQRWETAPAAGPGTLTPEEDTRTSFAYDLVGNLLSLTDTLDNETTYSYDGRNFQTSVTDPLGRTTTSTRDALGLLTERTDKAGRTTRFGYDALNRLATETRVDGLSGYGRSGDYVTTRGYDEEGNLTTVTDPASTLTFTHDALGRITAETQSGGSVLNIDAPTVALAHTWDDAGNLVEVRESVDGVAGSVTTSTYDGSNRLTSQPGGSAVAAQRIDYTYDGNGRYDTITRYAGTTASTSTLVSTTRHAYDELTRLSRLTHEDEGGDVFATYAYTYDAEDRLIRLEDTDGTVDYAYDGRGQLIAADYDDGQPTRVDESYAFDVNGNREAATTARGEQATITSGPNNRLLDDGVFTYAYDDAGNTLTRSTTEDGTVRSFAWDHDNRLTGGTDTAADGTVLTSVGFTYDALGRRTSQTDALAGTTERYAYQGEDVLLEFAGDTLARRNLHGPGVDQIFSVENLGGDASATPSVLHHFADHLGTARDLTDENGTVLNHRVYDAFGNLTDQSDPTVDTRYGFTGREFDAATGLNFHRARYLDPGTGRFLSEDPSGFLGGDQSLYRYAANGPTTQLDPSGNATSYFTDAWRGFKFAVSSPLEYAGTFLGSELPYAYRDEIASVAAAGNLVAETPGNYATIGAGFVQQPLEALSLAGTNSAAALQLAGAQVVDATTGIAAGIGNLPPLVLNGIRNAGEYAINGLGGHVCFDDFGYFDGTALSDRFNRQSGLLTPDELRAAQGATTAGVAGLGGVAGGAATRGAAAAGGRFVREIPLKTTGVLPRTQNLRGADNVARELRASASGRSFVTPEELAGLGSSGRIDASRLRFSQDTISPRSRSGEAVKGLADDLQSGSVDPGTIPPVNILIRNGQVVSLDNRRLFAFQEAGVPIRYNVLDQVPKKKLDRFSSNNEGISVDVRRDR